MPRHYLITPLSSFSFAQIKASQQPDTDYAHFGDDLHEYRTRYFEAKQDYYHPVKSSDALAIQFEQNAAGAVTCEIYNSLGQVAATVPGLTSYPTGYPLFGNVDAFGVQIYTFQWKFSFAQLELPVGNYRVVITGSISPNNDAFISEPIEVAEDQPNTLLFRYSHPQNDFEAVFNPLNPNFSFRVPGTIEPPQPESEDLSFEDDDKTLYRLKSKPYRSYTLQIGVDSGVPDWVTDKLNIILSCKTVMVGKTFFLKDDNAKWELSTLPGSRLSGATITLRESDAINPYKWSGGVVNLFLVAELFFISQFELTDGAVTNLFTVNTQADNSTLLDAILSGLNGLLPIEGHEGQLIVNGDYVAYENAEGEGFIGQNIVVLYENVGLTYNVANAAQDTNLMIRNGVLGIDWGDDTCSLLTGGAANTFATHTYGSTGNKSIRVFFSSAVTAFGSLAVNTNKITAIETPSSPVGIPAHITRMEFHGHNFGALNPAVFNLCSSVLTLLRITNSGVTSFTTDLFVTGRKFQSCTNLLLSGNSLDTSGVNNILEDIQSVAGTAPGATINLSGQSPSAPPSGAGATAKTFLTSTGRNVITDV